MVTNVRELVPGRNGDTALATLSPARGVWLGLAARVVELHNAGVIDDAAFAAVGRALDATRVTEAASASIDDLIQSIEQRAEAVLPAELSGVLALGGARQEISVAVLRLAAREHALRLYAAVDDLREVLLTLADEHTITLMPALIGGQPAQPTTFAHYLGGVIAPLSAAAERMQIAYVTCNRSPLGAGALAGGVIEVDRQPQARTLGFDTPVANTFDAVANIEDLVALLEAAAAVVAPVRRLLEELLRWWRTDLTSFRLEEEWRSRPEPSLPQLTVPLGMDRLATALREAEQAVYGTVTLLRSLGYAPIGSHADVIVDRLAAGLSQAGDGLRQTSRLFSTGLTVNRAYFANRAGRAFTTSGDLAAFLMTEEGLPPSVAEAIAGIVIARAMDAGLEVSGITPDAIDAAAVLTIGREVQVEMESLGRFLAPRRFLERRQVTGSPAPAMTRAWLAEERDRLATHHQWYEGERNRVDGALSELAARIADAAEGEA